ncbi:transmembrane protein 223 [Toxorhynchites rutilus septentrionalis]|uniref:transmembrane protein 223 n=1 Tax=Toxorhynchites rutilus septentrionalis TaxID=329112 RepID=UPI0024789029|nr:transmembrane protein 223 [Toxorhynchites rutilus septentrionalis]
MILRLVTGSPRSRFAAFWLRNPLSVIGTGPRNPIALYFSKNFNTTAQRPAPALSTRAYDINTNVAKDVMLFKYENPRFFRFLNIFAISQFMFWIYLTHFAYTTLKDAPVEEKDKEKSAWYEKINLGENKYRNGLATMTFIIGYGILFASWMFTLRSVRFLVLRKGGKAVSVITYTPFGKNRMMEVPMNCISAHESREAARVTIPIKIKNRSFFYILDKKGEFPNSRLYDNTVGLKRKLE